MSGGIVVKVWNITGDSVKKGTKAQLADSVGYILNSEKTVAQTELNPLDQLTRECKYVENDLKTFDGKINKDDVRVLLSYLPLKTDNSPIEYKIQMESQSEIDDILNSTFERKALLNIEEFRAVVENRKSDVYLQILCFLYQKKPFKNQNITTLKASKKKVTFFTPRTKASSPNIIPGVGTPSKKLLTPNRKSTLSPAEAFIRAAQLQENILGPKTKKSFVDENTPQVSGMKGMIRMNNKKIPQNTEIS